MNSNCTTMLTLSSSTALKTSMAFNLTIALIGFPLFGWSSLKLWTGAYTQNFHKNLRIIAQMHLTGFLLHCSGRIMLHSLDLYNYTFLNPCAMIPNIYRCFTLRLMYNFGMWVTMCTAVPLVLERTLATHLKGRYENKRIWYGILFASLHVFLAAAPLMIAYSNTKFDGVFMPYCNIYMPGHPEIANANSIIAITVQILARISFGCLFHVNKNLRSSMQRSSLSTRFQLEQNKNSMQCLKIYANTSTIFLLIQIPSFGWILNEKFRPEYYLALQELNCAFPSYGIITVFLVSRKIFSVHNQIHSSLESQMKLQGEITYFEHFNQQISTSKSS
ncbi:G_PROTEIN_RECEP_F1_2 domain-containing protein [Caenorhabditis elegans]|uniref:G_PROTEIN_RECEP_F1_2 domain-containing protein n=1 Tax=Caenorhabditis elegans TaxID=6239 RepID=Q5WRN5_CAEEL|nr:G_PROTEIN_RECEP_F1_2 domain-containing protein [Caenorhabditis elegans]CAH60771.2 G_PROTEIN_RECEP_F1_2 domain-containing protein [Caenorhabditis elegans]|eukprot:NP_001024134.1 Serpentine Receptor, class AB (class A-like) [Caenorhabditis elegans]